MSKRSFGPTLLAGLAGAGLAAIAGHKPWAHLVSGEVVAAGGAVVGERPEVTALALVALAAWGVVLVTRQRVRRVLIGLAFVASAVAVALSINGLVTMPEISAGFVVTEPVLEHGAWGWIALAGALVSALAALAAFKFAAGWPEMGRKYDAPTAASAPVSQAAPESSLDWWKAIDEGRDPTSGDDSSTHNH